MPIHRNAKDVRAFMGLVSYYRRFIKNCSQTAGPLLAILKKNNIFEWNPKAQAAFDQLKQSLASAPVLAHPDFTKPFLLATDASLQGIGAVLSQIGSDGTEHPIAYASRSLRQAEKNYPITELETLAVVEWVKYFRPYLFQQKVQVLTDHTAVKAVLQKENSSGRIARWGLALADIQLDIIPRKGTANGNADAFSRLPINNCHSDFNLEHSAILRPEICIIDPRPNGTVLALEQTRDKDLIPIIESLKKDPDAYKEYFLTTKDILMYRDGKGLERVVVPTTLRLKIIAAYHDATLARHFSGHKTLQNIKQKYYWDTMSHLITTYCKFCDKCQRINATTHPVKAILFPMTDIRGPFDKIGIDCMGPLTLTQNRNRFILVFVDYFTKYTEAIALKDITAQTVADSFVNTIVCHHSSPRMMISDQGINFLSNLMREVTVLYGTKHIFSSAYHPDKNGEVERMNNTLATRLRMYVDEGHFDWDRFLPYAVFSVNTHVNESFGFSFFFAVFGRNAKMPIDLDFIPQMEEPQAVITMLDHATPNIVLQLHEKEEDQTTYDNLRESSIMKFCHQFKNQQPQTAQKPHALNPIQMQDWTEKQTVWSQ